jgi:hypothetical protein
MDSFNFDSHSKKKKQKTNKKQKKKKKKDGKKRGSRAEIVAMLHAVDGRDVRLGCPRRLPIKKMRGSRGGETLVAGVCPSQEAGARIVLLACHTLPGVGVALACPLGRRAARGQDMEKSTKGFASRC